MDGWGRVVQQPEQLQYLKKLEFIPFKVSAPSVVSLFAEPPRQDRFVLEGCFIAA